MNECARENKTLHMFLNPLLHLRPPWACLFRARLRGIFSEMPVHVGYQFTTRRFVRVY